MSQPLATADQGLKALLTRATALDKDALVRFQHVEQGTNAFVTTPFQVLAARRTGEEHPEGVFRTADGSPALAAWPGALPPATGFQELDIIPVDVVHQLADQGRDLARQFSGPLGPPRSLLDQTVLEVSNGSSQANVTMRAIFTCTSFGFIPGIGSRPEIPRHLRVSRAGRWTRIDAPFGSVYQNQGLSLLI